MSEEVAMTTGKKKNRKRKNKISFDEELVSKDKADQLKLEEKEQEKTNNRKPPKRQKQKKNKQVDSITQEVNKIDIQTEINNDDENEEASPKKKKKRKKNTESKLENTSSETENQNEDSEENNEIEDVHENEEDGTQDELNPKNPEIKKTKSIRAMKREKHATLLQEKKNKSEVKMQEKSLNYLSQWKYNKAGWKFEKLRQIWLQQNMFDDARIPDKFWDTLVEYFNNAKGKSRDTILKDAVKVVDEFSSKSEEEEEENTDNIKYKRALAIVQHLQE